MTKFKFEPWNEQEKIKKPHRLDIQEPPCIHCKHWNPQAIYMPSQEGYTFDSIRLCWSTERYPDFSCFRFKEEDENNIHR